MGHQICIRPNRGYIDTNRILEYARTNIFPGKPGSGKTTCDHNHPTSPISPSPLPTNGPRAHTFMAHTFSSSSSSSNFQLIFNNALKVYEKRTKKDLLAHPLATQLQACQSPSTILVILQQQIHDLDQSRNADDRWTKWLDPTVNVLYAFSATLGEGVGLVCLRT
jgi:hypothetical protein